MGSTWNNAMFSLLHICIALIGHRAYEVGGFQSGRTVFIESLCKADFVDTVLLQECFAKLGTLYWMNA
jgi:hypothetical protein